VTEFNGFPVAALDFYDDLEMDNTKSFWEANKGVYTEAVRAPMEALTAALADEFGPAKIFRPYRDVRFAKDKTPYKTAQGAFVGVAPATGWYVQLSAAGVRVGAGFYDASSERLAAIRAGIDDDHQGPALERILEGLGDEGWQVGGDRLKTSPRGYDADHPRIELLRHKSLTVGKDYGFGEELQRPDLVDRVRDDWRATKPLLTWLTVADGVE
jgi:uncharacterized protein (TIGR02453 family)